MDLGITYHAEGEEPLVGLWKLAHAGASYAKGGMNIPVVHNTATLSQYGGMQAEMERSRARAVQFTFQSTYNLIYEVVRRPGKDIAFCDDSDAYVANPAFKKCLQDCLQMYSNAKRRRYGVREEIRGSGAAILEVLPHAHAKVCRRTTLLSPIR